MKLTEEQKQLVEEHYLAIMDISNKYILNNGSMIENKKLSKEDIEQIALEKACFMVKKHNEDNSRFITYLYNVLPFKINRAVMSYNIVKIPRVDNWDSGSNKDYKAQYTSVMYSGIMELDKVYDIGDGETGVLTLMEQVESKIIESNLSGLQDGFERFELEDYLKSHFNEEMAKALRLSIEGYNTNQIAKKIGIETSLMYGRLHRAKVKLRSIMKKDMVYDIG